MFKIIYRSILIFIFQATFIILQIFADTQPFPIEGSCNEKEALFENLITDFLSFYDEIEREFKKKIDRKIEKILVDKSRKVMYLLDAEGKIIKPFIVALGSEDGPKERRNDLKTPEGDYLITLKAPQSKFYRALEINYPNSEQRKWAIENDIKISELGDHIRIHGIGYNPKNLENSIDIHPKYNWTLGCIAVTNKQIEEIYSRVNVQTKVTICP